MLHGADRIPHPVLGTSVYTAEVVLVGAPRARRLRHLARFLDGGDAWRLGMPGGGPSLVVADFGCYGFVDGEMTLVSLHPRVALEEVRAATGWDLQVAPDLATTRPADRGRAPGHDLDRDRLHLG